MQPHPPIIHHPKEQGFLKVLLDQIIRYDIAFLKYLTGLSLPNALVKGLIFLVRIGDGYIWIFIAIALWKTLPMSQFQSLVLHCILAILISLALYWPIKLLIRRPRPHNAGLGIVSRVPPLDKYSFPSGHTMNNLAVALTLALYLPKFFIVALVFPLILGLLRILFGVHFLSDIAAGAILGGIGFFFAKLLFPFFHF